MTTPRAESADQWGSRLGFVLAAIGSAAGLGNIWRFSYVAGENGVIVVLEDSEDYTLLSKNDMGDAILATPAIADGHLFIRTRSKLICVGD